MQLTSLQSSTTLPNRKYGRAASLLTSCLVGFPIFLSSIAGSKSLSPGSPSFGVSRESARGTTEAANNGESWPLAVIFRIDAGRRVYVGASSKVTVPRPSTTKSPLVGTSMTHEIWYCRPGSIRGVRFSLRNKTWHFIDTGDSHSKPTSYRDNGTLALMVNNARTPARLTQVKADMISMVDYLAPPQSLSRLIETSRAVVVGRVAGVLRYGHSPVNSENPAQHTVFAVAVESWLKPAESSRAPIVKVHQPGGPLAWKLAIDGSLGIGYRVHNCAMVEVGERYILALTQPRDISGRYQRQGYISTTESNVTGKLMELDEYLLTDQWRGQVRLVDGVARAPEGRGGRQDWQFEQGGLQIVNVTEAQAIANVRAALANP